MSRAELTFEGPPPYPRYESGEFWATKHDDGSITIDRADPKIFISAEFLDAVRQGECDPGVTLNGDVLRMEASNRTVIYVMGEKVPDLLAYYAEWPD